MTDLAPYIQSIAVLAALALCWGGVLLMRRQRQPFKGVLMIVAALVLLGNVALWIVPV